MAKTREETRRRWRDWTIVYLGSRGIGAPYIRSLLIELKYAPISTSRIYQIMSREGVSLWDYRWGGGKANTHVAYIRRRHLKLAA